MSITRLSNYQASTHKLEGGTYLVKGGTLAVGGVAVLPR